MNESKAATTATSAVKKVHRIQFIPTTSYGNEHNAFYK